MSSPYDIESGPSTPITTEMLMRWKAYMSAIPLPPDGVPTGGIPLENVSREALLSCPPQVLAHIIQTASQGGLEVISPRQTPMCATMIRRTGDDRRLGDHDVFSKADPHPKWPCIDEGDDDDLDFLLPDEPMAPPETTVYKREKTRTKSLVTHDIEVVDPVLMCLVKGRATIDILNRPDVGGDGDALAILLAQAWGLKVDDIMDLGAYTLGVDGPLQRHAMKVDEVFSVVYAPVQTRSCITVGNVDTSKALLLDGYAIDWSRCRVFCEAVFYNSCVVEGLPIRYMGVPHNASAAGCMANGPNVLTFTPAPSIAWCYAPYTFALMPRVGMSRPPTFVIPEDVRNALQMYVKRVRPVSFVLSQGPRASLRQTQARQMPHVEGETIASAYGRTVAAVSTGMARGRGAMRSVRNAIYVCLEGASPSLQLRIACYTKITVMECQEHLRTSDVPTNVIRDLAYQFKDIGSTIREHIAREAERNKKTVTDWWQNAIAQVPKDLQGVAEGSFGWAMVGLYLLFKKPTDKWKALERALNFRAHMLGNRGASCSLALPAEIGSLMRLVAAAQGAARSVTETWYGYYKAVADVGMAVGKEAARMGKNRISAACITGARLWEFRARSMKASNVHPVEQKSGKGKSQARDAAEVEDLPAEGGEGKKSAWHFHIPATPCDLVLKPAPYNAYKSLLEHLRACEFVSRRQLGVLDEYEESDGPISPIFERVQGCFMAAAKTKVTRYVLDPPRLAHDLEKGWKLLVDDLIDVASRIREETEEVTAKKRQKVTVVENIEEFEFVMEPAQPMDIEQPALPGKSFWQIYGALDPEVAMALDDRLYSLDPAVGEDITSSHYRDLDDLERAFQSWEDSRVMPGSSRGETIR